MPSSRLQFRFTEVTPHERPIPSSGLGRHLAKFVQPARLMASDKLGWRAHSVSGGDIVRVALSGWVWASQELVLPVGRGRGRAQRLLGRHSRRVLHALLDARLVHGLHYLRAQHGRMSIKHSCFI